MAKWVEEQFLFWNSTMGKKNTEDVDMYVLLSSVKWAYTNVHTYCLVYFDIAQTESDEGSFIVSDITWDRFNYDICMLLNLSNFCIPGSCGIRRF